MNFAINYVEKELLADTIRERLSRRVPQSKMKIMSEGKRNEGKQHQLNNANVRAINERSPNVRVK